MKINKYIKKSNGNYEVVFDNNLVLELDEEVIINYRLLYLDEISDQLIEEIKFANNKYRAYNLSIKYISRRLRSIYEMNKYLQKKDFSEEEVEFAISKLIKEGYLNDEKFVKAFINDRINLTNHGPYKILKDINNNFNVDENITKEALLIFTDELSKQRINSIIEKELNKKHASSSLSPYKRIEKGLVNLGYDYNLISSCMSNYDFNNQKLYEQEYKKLYDKYQKKYEGTKLELVIKQKLYEKGYK